LWGQGIAQKLLDRVMAYFANKPITHAGLTTFPQSPKHIALYRKFGYFPRFLTALVSAQTNDDRPAVSSKIWTTFHSLSLPDKTAFLERARAICNAIYEGLDLSKEIEVVERLGTGDTIIVYDDDAIQAFAVCHHGAGSEADNGVCYIKFAATAPGSSVSANFSTLLDACFQFASSCGAEKLFGGVSTAREEAHDLLLSKGFRIDGLSVFMHKPNEPGYCRPGVFVMDDWR
jgi:hypothetical protein